MGQFVFQAAPHGTGQMESRIIGEEEKCSWLRRNFSAKRLEAASSLNMCYTSLSFALTS